MAWLSSCDIICFSIIGVYQKVEVVFFTEVTAVTTDSYVVQLNTWQSVVQLWGQVSIRLEYLLNEYSTGPVILLMAVERFIMIVLPFKAQAILTHKYYMISSTILVLFGLFLSLVGSQEPNRESDMTFSG